MRFYKKQINIVYDNRMRKTSWKWSQILVSNPQNSMSAQALQSFGDLSAWKEANAPISVAISDRSVAIPGGVLREFEQLFLYDWHTQKQFPFSKKTRDYFQSTQPLSSEEIRRIAMSICGATFWERAFINKGGRGWERMDMDAREEKDWFLCIEDSLRNRMHPTDFERLCAFVSEQTRKLLSIYEV